MTELEKIKTLKSKRKTTKAALTRHQTAVNQFKDGDNGSVFESRLADINQLFKEYNQIQSEIENLQLTLLENNNAPQEDHEALENEINKERSEVETQYYHVITQIKSILTKNKPNGRDTAQGHQNQTIININRNTEHSENLTNLKPLPLPIFSGKHGNWYTFHESFKALVDDDKGLSDIKKFHYLRGCLRDDALRAVESLSVSKENYKSALELLINRYENKRLIVQEHVTNIINLQPIGKSSHTELRELLDIINNNITALKTLQLPVDSWDALLIAIICEKLDYHTKREWQTKLDKELPTYRSFIEFLEKRCQVLESLTAVKTQNPTPKFNNNARGQNSGPLKKSNKFITNVIVKNTCVFCKESHASFQCEGFLNLSVSDRLKQIQSLKLCRNCLRANHTTENCKITSKCKTCHQNHHTLLHINEFMPSTSTLLIKSPNQVLLSTAEVLISDKHGTFHNCRVLLDQCSEANIITSGLCKKLKLNPTKISSSVLGVNANETPVSERVSVVIKSKVNDFASNLHCLVLNNITKPTPAVTFDKSLIDIPANLTLADTEFNLSKNIDLLIGAPLFWNLLIGGPIQLHKNQPYLQETQLGWILGGNLHLQNPSSVVACNLISQHNANVELQSKKIWDTGYELTSKLTGEQLACEEHFIKNSFRDSNGKFVVKLPFKNEINLGNSHALALKQFYTLEKRLNRDPDLNNAYKQFMAEYLSLDHMERVPVEDLENPSHYYLPHHAVFKRTVNGPKIRVVFNGSAKTTNGLSLNDNLMTGVTSQEDLFSLLCRFRTFQYALSADITKMFRMILVNPSDRNFQRILWRDHPNKAIETFRLKTVTYGTTCAPFLAVRTLFQLALQAQDAFPLASKIIMRDFFMDDLITGSHSLQEAIELRDTITKILKDGGFDLCKWASNCQLLLPENSYQRDSVTFTNNEDVKVLGFHWNCPSDELKYNVDLVNVTEMQTVTKRNILSAIAKVFDPIGLIDPIIVKVKILLQNLWTLKLNWDQRVPEEIKDSWLQIVNELKELNNYRIPRKLIPTHPNSIIEIHGFADASSKAYGATIYLKVIDTKNKATVNLLCSKSRVAPLKPTTLPRLELNAAVLLCKLMDKTIKILHLDINAKYYWTDSTIVLCWLAEPPNQWKQYIANRVTQIQASSSREQWHHVRSADNPADIVSRGMLPRKLRNCKLWWHGPEWLTKNPNEWPVLPSTDFQRIETTPLLEKRPSTVINLIKMDPELSVITKFSSFAKLTRVIAYCLRFIEILKTKQKKTVPKSNAHQIVKLLSIEDLNRAEIVILRHIQMRAFPDLIHQISNIGKVNKLQGLDPFIDNNGLLRVGGRLKNAPISYDHKHQIILPKDHPITKLIIEQIHIQEMHAGNQATLAAVRQRFWPLSGRSTVKKIIHSCTKCSRAKPTILIPKMGDLPKHRVQPARPFYVSAVDYAGPFLIKDGKSRNTRKIKAYIALFVCFATKAVHLELVSDLTTESFLAALKRFVSRRGNVSKLYSDNGTNFTGAERELFKSQSFQNKIMEQLTPKCTKFSFIPPKSPHFGGLWERAVRSAKHHLHRVVGDASLTYEEFYTFLTCIEACLNSRPITPLSEDPNDLEALTPGHFLIGAALTSPIEANLTEISMNRLSRWQRIQQLHQHFWNRWYKEYLHQLQPRPKGQQTSKPNLTIGTLVVLIEENLPPLKWKLGRVVDIHPGSDGVVRVVSVKTVSGIYKRAVKKVCVIPRDEI